eukprot:TRINITY_DN6102_c0_g1_i1.p1 TRINITY_DN6102_c0_g1~~TRINITY_DN6102_c0_g1_i1.p1  ORF type:complete len:123 (-),score=34.25 TRINITY_DN6102_c0_g1_i1:240-572(-)
MSLGLEIMGTEKMHVLIPKNSSVPTKKKYLFSTFSEKQTSVTLMVYEGDHPKVDDNSLIGMLTLDEISPDSNGGPNIEVTFDLDANGMLQVTARDKPSGHSKSLKIVYKH